MKSKKFYCVVGMLFIFLLSLSFSAAGRTMIGQEDMTKFLGDNKISFSVKDNFSGLDILKEDVSKNDVFLTGEFHCIGWNEKVRLNFLKYLNKTAGVRYFLSEMGYSRAQLMNKYLKTGDEKILVSYFDNLGGTGAYVREELDLWRELYKYNRSLPQNKKITIVGIDIEIDMYPAMDYIKTLIPKNKPPKEILNTIEKLKSGGFLSFNVSEFFSNFKKNQKLYKSYFKDKYYEMEYVVRNCLRTMEASKSSNFGTIREKYIYDNFKEQFSRLPKGKYYGQFGRDHVFQHQRNTGFMEGKTLADLLQNGDSPVKGKVLSIPIGYKDCTQTAYYDRYNPVPCEEEIDLGIFEPFIENDINLFKITGDNSPFAQSLQVVNEPVGGNTTDYFQYILIMKGSPACHEITAVNGHYE